MNLVTIGETIEVEAGMSITELFDRVPQRIWDRIEVDMFSGCWVWRGGLDGAGYGTIWAEGSSHRAHRYMFKKLRGEIGRGMVLDHLLADRPLDPGPCTHGPSCCNPWHTEPVTVEINAKRVRSWNAVKTHCPSGHPYAEYIDPETGETVPGTMVVYVGADGYCRRYCTECVKVNRARSKARRKAA